MLFDMLGAWTKAWQIVLGIIYLSNKNQKKSIALQQSTTFDTGAGDGTWTHTP
mgnify:CR=1 FL=1